jgi:hypothetical protein
VCSLHVRPFMSVSVIASVRVAVTRESCGERTLCHVMQMPWVAGRLTKRMPTSTTSHGLVGD